MMDRNTHYDLLWVISQELSDGFIDEATMGFCLTTISFLLVYFSCHIFDNRHYWK
jgi:ABC-type multidrug transport system permease subunit